MGVLYAVRYAHSASGSLCAQSFPSGRIIFLSIDLTSLLLTSTFPFSWGWLTCRFCASLKHKYDGQTKFIKPNSQIQDRIIKYWVSIGSIHREQG